MPFKSEKQRRFMFAKHPEIAKRWTAEERLAGKLARSGGRTRRRAQRASGRGR